MATAVSAQLRTEALGLLDKSSSLLDIARELSRLIREAGIPVLLSAALPLFSMDT